MRRIGLLSDTHGYLDPKTIDHFMPCDEIWHAGDFGSLELIKSLQSVKPLRGVYGNIDGQDIKSIFPQTLCWTCEDIRVVMTHIGGNPPKYAPGLKKQLMLDSPDLFICGHSHILKIMYDDSLPCLYINPGAAGNQGWHKIRTLVRFIIDGKDIRDCEIIELGNKARLPTT